MDIFSARVKWARERKMLSQKDIAEKIGMSPQGYGKIENGQREPKLEILAKFPEILDESVDFLIGVTDFDHHGYNLLLEYREAFTNVVMAEDDLLMMEVNPHDENLRSRTFNPDNPEEVKAQIEKIKKYLIGWRRRRDQTKPRLLKYLETIPMVSEKAEKAIREIEEWKEIMDKLKNSNEERDT